MNQYHYHTKILIALSLFALSSVCSGENILMVSVNLRFFSLDLNKFTSFTGDHGRNKKSQNTILGVGKRINKSVKNNTHFQENFN